MTAAALLHEARAAGVEFAIVDGTIRLFSRAEPTPELLARLRATKPEITAILQGDACRTCGAPLAWPRALGLVFHDGTAECMPCCDGEVERLLAAGQRAANPDLAADPAETMIRGELA